MQPVDNCRYRSCRRHHVNWDRAPHIGSPRILDKQMRYNTKQLMQGWWTEMKNQQWEPHILANYTFCLIFYHHNHHHQLGLLRLHPSSSATLSRKPATIRIYAKKKNCTISLICNYDIYLWLLSSIKTALASQASIILTSCRKKRVIERLVLQKKNTQKRRSYWPMIANHSRHTENVFAWKWTQECINHQQPAPHTVATYKLDIYHVPVNIVSMFRIVV